MKKKKQSVIESQFSFDKKQTGLFFLGVGITMLILNMVAMITSIQQIIQSGIIIQYPFGAFYFSFLCSIILIMYSVLNIYEEK